ncbi:glycosyltransferase involved in cell wall biosynthesis [Undibacterium sp. GrIS 1.2]|uniref:glycosyltransferase family 4 protein n=1 Tax=Undibacterium sp. GrIS 1.2 TaxID=3143933 RepID=UPI0033917644
MMHRLKKIALNNLPVYKLRNRLQLSVKHLDGENSSIRQLLVDVSAIAQSDAKTGIQRVVRNLYQQLLRSPPNGYRICPIVASRKNFYHHVPANFLNMPTTSPGTPIQVRAGDIFLGLDLSAHIIPHHLPELWAWKKQGLHICIVIYDLLPVLHPQWFNPRATENFHRWLRAVALLADRGIAISRTVQVDFHSWLSQKYDLTANDIPCATIMLGSELDSDSIATEAQLPKKLDQCEFILMVGTIEPRKGYDDALDAFEALWETGNNMTLVIAGKQGWKVDALVRRLQSHLGCNNQLHWIENANDNVLRTLYQNCKGVIVASRAEGFGLPLIEAARFNKPLLVRDIPIFREVAGDTVSYFSALQQKNLTHALKEWLIKLNEKDQIPGVPPVVVTWHESCKDLIAALQPLMLSSTENMRVPELERDFKDILHNNN